ncbi:hypothetical protein [Solimonas sp. SE-A11]|uniref:hypothetical protein n=1 Tax=Solimonas sp. SE-A11 TaxID=3054954 RepID=UPI00259C6EF6|nr:hypothetical protein [Solimonas sp. SE-A11]MDM4769958.1 hypothetical protein [Solimonas sp. SE-A11]
MSPTATLVATHLGPASSPALLQSLWTYLRAWRGPTPSSGYDEPPSADAHGAILERDPAIQPETLARLFW